MSIDDDFEWFALHGLPPRPSGSLLDALAKFRSPGSPDLSWDRVIDALKAMGGWSALQFRLDVAVKSAGLTYRHAWFSWELLRRSETHWERCAWWLRNDDDDSPSRRALRRQLGQAMEEWEVDDGYYRALGLAVGEIYWDMRPTLDDCPLIDPDRTFPRPLADGSCPKEHEVLETLLWVLLAPFCGVPLLVEGGEDAQPTDLPEHHARVVLDLHAHDDAILAAVNTLRTDRSIPKPTKTGRNRKVWGSIHSAESVIELLEHIEGGGTTATWGILVCQAEQQRLAAESEGDDDARDAPDASNTERTAHAALKRVLDALKRDPLRAIAR